MILDLLMIVFGAILLKYMATDTTRWWVGFIGFAGFLICLSLFLHRLE